MKKSVLVLGGGAMRSLYTSGILDVLMENNIEFDCVVGVSAGALTGCNYISGQKGRTANININYCKDSRYIGIKAYKNNKGLIGFDYLFDTISREKIPFDWEKFNSSDKRFVIGATNCKTGKTEFFEKGEEKLETLLQASSSMPIVSDIVNIKGQPYLDGAVDCNIPIEWAINENYEKIVVVLTRSSDYRKKEMSKSAKKLYDKKFSDYPKLLDSIYNRPQKYNELYERIKKMKNENKIFVFQPQKAVKVSRLERNKEKLKELYTQGIDEAEERIEELKKYLN